VLNVHVLPTWRGWRLRDIERLAVQQWVAEKFRQQCGWQSVRNAWVVLLSGFLETAVEYGFLSVNPARGVKFPQKELKERPAIIAGDSFVKLLTQVDEPYRTMVGLIAATGLRIGELVGLRMRPQAARTCVCANGRGDVGATTSSGASRTQSPNLTSNTVRMRLPDVRRRTPQ
jgi:site-specific recombinase XerC